MSAAGDAKADNYRRLYSELQSESKTDVDNRAELKTFVERHVPASDIKELDNELKKTVPLSGRQLRGKRKRVFRKGGGKDSKFEPVRRRQGKLLTARERRDLGLHRLPKKGLKYTDVVPINRLWLEYISGLVDLSKWSEGDESFQVRLCRADYHGAEVKVTRSPNAALVGIGGLVAAETRNTLQIIGRDDKLRTVPKKGASFTFRAGESHVFTVGGSSMLMKPSERAVKKWKNRAPLEL